MSSRDASPSRREFLGTALGVTVGSGSLAALLAACGGSDRAPVTSPTVVPHGQALDVTDFGAKGDGATDDTDAIERALAALRPGGSLSFPAGRTFGHSRVIVVDTPNTRILGPGRLLAMAEATSAVQIDADGVTVRGLSFGVASTTQRWSAPAQHKLYLGTRKNIVVRDVSIDGSAAAGLFCYGTSQLQISDVRVANTRADGIHLTNGCHDVVVESPVTTATGDDGIAVVSYRSDSTYCQNIIVNNARVTSTTGGRGMSVVGGSHVSYKNVGISGTNAAGLYIACENGDFVSYSVDNVTVSGGRIDGANTNAAIDHGAVLVYSARPDGGVSNVTVDDLVVTNTRPTASRQIGVVVTGDAPVEHVSFGRLTLDATPVPYEGNAPVSGISMRDVRAAGAAVVASVTP